MSENYKAPGNISITRRMGPYPDKSIIIQVEDGVSGVKILDFQMSLEAFSEAVTGLGYCKGDLEIYTGALSHLGMKTIRKEVIVTCREEDRDLLRKLDRVFSGDWGKVRKCEDGVSLVQRIFGTHESDGWVGSLYDVLNHHNMVTYSNDPKGNCEIRVTFSKWVSASEAKAYDEETRARDLEMVKNKKKRGAK